MNLRPFTTPLQPHEVEWRVQSKSNGKTIVVPYINNRAVMNRLDEVCGADKWRNEFQRWGDKSVLCGLSIKIGDEWVTKWDGADDTGIEPTKGGISDAMKRAAVQWGMARDLYTYPRVFLDGEHKYIPSWAQDRLNALVNAFIEGKLDKSVYTLKQS